MATKAPHKLLVVVAIMTAMLFLVACGTRSEDEGSVSEPGEQQATKRRGGVLRIVDEPPNGPFGVPWESVPPGGYIVATPALEPLLWMDWTGEIRPKLAKRWEVEPEQETVTLYLRQGVKFHDGTDFNAEAVRFNLEQAIAKRLIPIIRSVAVVDDHTVRLQLDGWDNSIFLYLAGTQSFIVSPTAIEQNGIEWARYHPVGTGPFRFKDFQRDVSVSYSRFDQYWDAGKPYLEGIEYHFIRDPQTLRASFLNKEFDLFGTSDRQLTAELAKSGYPYTHGMSGTNITMLVPNSADPDSPLADQRVRLAVSHAIDRAALVEARGFGLAQPAYQLAVQGLQAYLEDFDGHPYDPDRAKGLLAEAGYANGFSTKLIAPPSEDREMVVAIQRYLANVGIRAEIEIPDDPRYREYQTKGWDGFLVQGGGFYANYNRWIQFRFLGGPQVLASLRIPDRLQPMWNESRSTPEQDEEKVEAMNRLLMEEVTVIPVVTSSRFYVSQPYVRDTHHQEWVSPLLWTPAEAWLDQSE